MGRFRRRFEALDVRVEGKEGEAVEGKVEDGGMAGGVEVGKREVTFDASDLEWMGQGARELKAPVKPVPKAQTQAKKK